jgi:hypothetical protein
MIDSQERLLDDRTNNNKNARKGRPIKPFNKYRMATFSLFACNFILLLAVFIIERVYDDRYPANDNTLAIISIVLVGYDKHVLFYHHIILSKKKTSIQIKKVSIVLEQSNN